MGTVLFSAIITAARFTLLDPAPGKTWSDASLLLLGNEALSRLALVKPDIYPVKGAIPMVAGADQALPTGGTQLFKLMQNVVSGKRINQVSESLLIEEARWSAAPTAEVDVDSYAIDARDSTRFIVTPPNTGAGSVLALYGSTPAISAVVDVIPIDDIYQIPLKFFLLSECYAANTTRQDLSKSAQYATSAMNALGMDAQSKAAAHPKLGNPGGG